MYIFVTIPKNGEDEEEAYARNHIEPDEFKLCAKGRLRIFETNPKMEITEYNSDRDAFFRIRVKI